MSFLDSVSAAVAEMIGNDDRPVIVYSAAWPFLREMRETGVSAVESLLDVLLGAAHGRSVLMPTFTGGYVGGVCDLDREPISTGVIADRFRARPGVRRTLSAFFSFAVSGPATAEVIDLRPKREWGEGSLYEWMEKRDAYFLAFGTHPTHVSYLHRLEWLARDRINYRFEKAFRGRLIREGIAHEMEETLYVRRLDPPVINDFTLLMPYLYEAGMKTVSVRGVSVACYRAEATVAAVVPVLRKDPYFTVQNRKDYENA